MPDLIAQGKRRQDRWRRRLPALSPPIVLGREAGAWSIAWDPCVSRHHLQFRMRDGLLVVERLPQARNPVFFRGEAVDQCQLEVGEHFVVGDTTFALVDHRAEVSIAAPVPDNQQTFSPGYLREVGFRQAHQQIQALMRLPDILADTEIKPELYGRLVDLLLTSITSSRGAAIVAADALSGPDATSMRVLHWDRTDGVLTQLQPSATLIRESLTTGQSIVHAWHRRTVSSESLQQQEFDWAFCTPIPGADCRGIAIYVAGETGTSAPADALHDALKFVELVATAVGNACDMRALRQQAAALSHFFSPPVREAVAAAGVDSALAPRETEVSVMFCDLRGFSRRSEQQAADLFGLLQRVSEALGLATHEILEHRGVIGDFHGDAVMGFWGWPVLDGDRVTHACRAALAIRDAFETAADSSQPIFSGFRSAIGLATGVAVAGKIGTVDQVKVTAFGPVVNTAARLEGITRIFDVGIL
ncbi:MAG: adenylate/guanylate cyclase domain-containing protein, partial [Planctomycetales bacterium]|nr:adenylate/guanylate cyclase domain-containing protein [Planctomycetales bacterium]